MRRMLCVDETICQAGGGEEGRRGDTQFPKSTPTSAAVIKPETQRNDRHKSGLAQAVPEGLAERSSDTAASAAHWRPFIPRHWICDSTPLLCSVAPQKSEDLSHFSFSGVKVSLFCPNISGSYHFPRLLSTKWAGPFVPAMLKLHSTIINITI